MKTWQVPQVREKVRRQWTHVEVLQNGRVIKELSSPALAHDYIKRHNLKDAYVIFARH